MRMCRRAALRPLVAVATPDEVFQGCDPGLLSAGERARSASMRDPADRAAYEAAHLLVRRCAAALTGRPAAELMVRQWCATCGVTGHGRPSLTEVPGVHVSWAHTRGAVVATAAWHPVGVDVERMPAAPAGVAAPGPALGLSPAEQRRVAAAVDPALLGLRYWVRKECLVKVGVATLAGLHEVDLSRLARPRRRHGWSVSRYGDHRLVDWCDPDRRVLIAVAGAGPPVVCSVADLARMGVDSRPGASNISDGDQCEQP
ncbi:4'-phosphopantetheinyl transferase superfamily protein [Modestobacter roseus]|uniref:4'-phosphopantetheinyl transferase superfamily protein n=1 Tax=Modestobacter roseus TaxID=1181884 RepID=A0A562IS21_9ACTN|nr:4'-phosphopantetheinyl transferase superfamily protein [Modestobacter roseus]